MTIFAILSYDADRRDAHGKVLFFIKDIIKRLFSQPFRFQLSFATCFIIELIFLFVSFAFGM